MNRSRRLWYLLLHIFWPLSQRNYFWERCFVLGSIPTHFWHFSNIFQFLKILSLNSFTNYNAFYTRYPVWVCLWWIEYSTFLIYCKVPKEFLQDCLRIIFYSLHFEKWFKFLRTTLFLLRKKLNVQKLNSNQS